MDALGLERLINVYISTIMIDCMKKITDTCMYVQSALLCTTIILPSTIKRSIINSDVLLVLFQNSEISLFETNIRFMGSLLACYALTGDVMFRDKAAQLGERMLPAFQTETGIPHSLINLHTGVSAAFRCHNTLVLASTRRDGFDVL